MSNCSECGTEFKSKGAWQKLCSSCFSRKDIKGLKQKGKKPINKNDLQAIMNDKIKDMPQCCYSCPDCKKTIGVCEKEGPCEKCMEGVK